MKNLKWLNRIEFHMVFCRKNRLILLAVFILASISIFSGASEYRNAKKQAKIMQQNELSYFKRTSTYSHYSIQGINVIYVPSATMVFFSDNSQMGRNIGHVNSIGKLEINWNRTGNPIASSYVNFTPSLHTIIYLFFTIASLYLGFDFVSRKEFLRFNITASSLLGYYGLLFGLRLAYLFGTFLVLFGSMVGLASVIGIALTRMELWLLSLYCLVVLGMIAFFFISGTLLAYIKTKMGGVAALSAYWVFMILVVPTAVQAIINRKQGELTHPSTLLNAKMNVLEKFEKSSAQKYGKLDKSKMDQARQVVEGYWNNDFKEMEAIDLTNLAATRALIKSYTIWSLLSPVTFFNSTATEISSLGYNNYLNLYQFLITMQRDFGRFWIDRVYYHNPKIMKNFIQGNQNLFMAQATLPAFFAIGMGIYLGWIALLWRLSIFLLTRTMSQLTSKECAEIGTLAQDWPKDELVVFQTTTDSLKNYLFTLFFNQNKPLPSLSIPGEIRYNQENLLLTRTKRSLLYVCKPDDWPPELRVKDLLGYATAISTWSAQETLEFLEKPELQGILGKRFKQLSKLETLHALLALTDTIKRDIYLVNDIAPTTPSQALFLIKDRLESLTQEAMVIYFTSKSINFAAIAVEEKPFYYNPRAWVIGIELLKVSEPFNKNKKKEGDEKNA